jgi:hypothetical protein
MPAPDNLKKNQTILWARDILGREEECVIVCCDTEDTASINKTGNVTVLSLSGGTNRVDIPFVAFSDASARPALKQKFAGKEVICVGIDESFGQTLLDCGASRITDLMQNYRDFLAMEVNISPNCNASNLATWTFDALRTMASSSLVLDQADTGEQKWTSSHFKVTPGVLDKLRSFMK